MPGFRGVRMAATSADAGPSEVGTIRRMQLKVKRDVEFQKLINLMRYRMHRGLTTELDAMGRTASNNALKAIISAEKFAVENKDDPAIDCVPFVPMWVTNQLPSEGEQSSVFRLALRPGKLMVPHPDEVDEEIRVSAMTEPGKLGTVLKVFWSDRKTMRLHAKGEAPVYTALRALAALATDQRARARDFVVMAKFHWEGKGEGATKHVVLTPIPVTDVDLIPIHLS